MASRTSSKAPHKWKLGDEPEQVSCGYFVSRKMVQERMKKNMDAMNRLASCHSLQGFVTVQSDVARDRLGHTVESSRRLAEVSLRVADEAARVIQSQAGRNAGEMEKNLRRVS
jgi:phasin family protein